MSLAIVVAYSIYLEMSEDKLNPDWKVVYPVDFWTFRDLQMLEEYNQIKRKYPGDVEMRRCTSQKRDDQSSKKERSPICSRHQG